MNCKYCGKECKNNNSLHNHERLCKENPNRQFTYFAISDYNKTRIPSNQFIKAKNEGKIFEVSKETREKIGKIWKGKKHSNKTKQQIQNTISKNIFNNNWHTNLTKQVQYKNEYFDSSWEILFVKYLENKNIKWIRPKNYFEYKWENSIHRYYPDIYLPDYNLYIEIKGIPSDRDYCKWEQFTEKLDIYDSYDLYNLGILDGYDNRLLIKENFRLKHINL